MEYRSGENGRNGHASMGAADGGESHGAPDALVIVALGGNDKGDWPDQATLFEAALVRLADVGVTITARSSWWRSRAWPDPTDPPFLNGIVLVRTAHDPQALMAILSRTEAAMGRVRSRRNAPRTLDLDLIAYGRLCGDFDGLILPHPRAAERLFVMAPLAEVAPDWIHPVLGLAATDLAATATVGADAHVVETG